VHLLDETHPFIKQLLAGLLQAFPTLLDASPLIQHAGNFSIDLVDATDQPVAHVEMFGHTQEVLPEVRLLAVRNRTINQRKPVVKLLRCLDRLLRMKGMCVGSGGRARAWGGRA
jgi:hypothetical protein